MNDEDSEAMQRAIAERDERERARIGEALKQDKREALAAMGKLALGAFLLLILVKGILAILPRWFSEDHGDGNGATFWVVSIILVGLFYGWRWLRGQRSDGER